MHIAELSILGKLAMLHTMSAGLLADERLRRRKAGEISANTSPLRGSEDGGASGGPSPERAQSELVYSASSACLTN